MNVLTWHGAVLRVDWARQRLVQDPVWMTGPDGADFTFDATDPAPQHVAVGSFVVEPGERPKTVRFSNPAGYLSAAPGKRDVGFEADEGQPSANFLLVSAENLADLRHILAHRWRVRPGAQLLEKADIKLVPGFGLALGPLQVDLTTALPLASYSRRPAAHEADYSPPHSFVLNVPGGDGIEMADGLPQGSDAAQQFELVQHGPPLLSEAASSLAFKRNGNSRLTLKSGPRYVAPPLVTRMRDSALFATWLEGRSTGTPQSQPACTLGFVSETYRIRREQKRYVVLSRGCEGLVFDQNGTSSDISHLAALPQLPAGFIERDGRIWASGDVLGAVPRLDGPLLVFYDGGLDSYTRWLTGAMPALDAISRHVPRSSRLLLPAGLKRIPRGPGSFDHRELMMLLGFGRLPAIESGADIVWVDDVIFAEATAPEAIPAEQLHEFRERALAPHDGPGEPTRRIYIKRTDHGSVLHGHEIERFLNQQGFEPVVLEHLPLEQQIALFRQASFVVAAHGDALSNVMFARPGLRVLELMDGGEFEPDIWRLCGKLGHLYGFLGCPSDPEDPQARLDPDADRFRNVFQMLDNYRL